MRQAIFVKAQSLGLSPDDVLNAHLEREHLGDHASLLADVEERYGVRKDELRRRVVERASRIAATGRYDDRVDMFALETEKTDAVLRYEGSELVLLAIPDEEFLVAIEHVVAFVGAARRDRATVGRLITYVDETLAAHGLPYAKQPGEWRFEWSGDPAVRALTVVPALQALEDPRLAGARAEFEESLGKRSAGGLKNYEDAIDEAAKSVESALKVLVAANDLGVPPRQGALSLFGKLTENGVLPGHLQKLATAAADMRNVSAAHGQGAAVRDVPAEDADAAIGSAAVAVTRLASFLQ